mmetsp:Transcript_28617/g.41620  ORF Transcript_28617/g.41620 Transcript_28617/m.41620 type:complete len:437 (-) Transcript_28617:187-1497(-)
MLHNHRHRHRPRRQRGKRSTFIIYISVAIMFIWCYAAFYFFLVYSAVENPNSSREVKQEQKNGHAIVDVQKNLGSWILPNEIDFVKTITSCIPSDCTSINRLESKKKRGQCLQFVPETGKERIGILSPPGILSNEFYNWVIKLLETNHEELGSNSDGNNIKIELISTSHVPPYGYGKNHGWTKIIRFVTDPIALGLADIVMYQGGEMYQKASVSSTGEVTRLIPAPQSVAVDSTIEQQLLAFDENNGVDIKEELPQALRQMIRWNCRLSHVSAHTALLTVALQEIIEDPATTATDLLSFIFSTGMKKGLDDSPKKAQLMKNKIDTTQLKRLMNDIVTKHASSFFDEENQNVGREYFNKILQTELEKTNNLSDWPCLSFWSVSNNDLLSVQKRARDLAPNCTAEHTKCSVTRDLCEEEGDVECKAPPKEKRIHSFYN